MSEWKGYKLGEVCSRLRSGKNLKSNLIFPEGKYPVWGGNGVRGYTNECNFSGQCCVIGRQGAYCGNVHYYEGEAYMTEHAIVVVGNELADTYYLACALSLMHLENLSAQSAQPGISVQTLSAQTITLPPIDEQKRIAGVLSSLDDKIDLLHRENATLEALAETLFRHYFIENPDPEWKEGKVSDIAIHCKDSINPQKHFDEIFSHYRIPAYDNGKRPTEEQGQNIQSNKYVIPQNCILFSKLNPHKDKRVWLMLDDVQPNAICSTEFQIVKPQNDQWLYFLYEWLTYKENYDEIALGVSGTSGSHQRIDPKVIFENECPIVDDSTIEQYNAKVKPLFEKIKTNQQQILSLTAQRDTLLPRIMIGEVKINE